METEELVPKDKFEELKQKAKEVDIVELFERFGLTPIRTGRTYITKEHDSLVITPATNSFYWNSRVKHGDTITLVQDEEIGKGLDFYQAVLYLNDLDINIIPQDRLKEIIHEPFEYEIDESKYTNKIEQYLHNERGISYETIHEMIEKKIIAQTVWYINKKIENVLIFKYLYKNEITGAGIKGITLETKGYKHILKNCNGYTGFNFSIGKPNKLYAFESGVDSLSFYDHFKKEIDNAFILSMDGRKESIISNYYEEILNNLGMTPKIKTGINTLEFVNNNADQITSQIGNLPKIYLGVDNDEAGIKFLNQMLENYPNLPIVDMLPRLENETNKVGEKTKLDWNDYLLTDKTISFVSEQKIQKNRNKKIKKIPQDIIEKNSQTETINCIINNFKEEIDTDKRLLSIIELDQNNYYENKEQKLSFELVKNNSCDSELTIILGKGYSYNRDIYDYIIEELPFQTKLTKNYLTEKLKEVKIIFQISRAIEITNYNQDNPYPFNSENKKEINSKIKEIIEILKK